MTSSDLWDADAAARYDEAVADMFEPDVLDPTVDLLAELAGNGPVLEFAVGTGRVALPLAERGIAVTGLEFSHRQPPHPGRAGRVLPQRRSPPDPRRALRHRGRGAFAEETPAGPGGGALRPLRVTPRLRHVRLGHPAGDFTPLHAPGRRHLSTGDAQLPLRLAQRTRPHGPARRDGTRGPVCRVVPRALHRRQRVARVGLAPPR